MKFTPKLPDGDVNISKSHPLKEAAWLVGGLLLILTSLYIFLGFFSGLVAMRLPAEAEVWVGNKISTHFHHESNEFLQDHLDHLVRALPDNSPMHAYTFRVFLDDSDQINALALPGGCIVILEGLLKTVESENELDMILAHELGHFAHHDHLQSMGRSLLVLVCSLILPGDQSSNIVAWIASKLGNKYSQKQETAADAWGLDLLNRHYGHVGGATDFLKRLAGKNVSHFAYFLATHPHPENRVKNLNKLITEHGYALRDTIPLNTEGSCPGC